jgi:hypothetical protein
MGNNDFQEYLVQKIEAVHKEMYALRKLQENDSRENAIQHKDIDNKIKNIEESNDRRDTQCMKNHQFYMDNLVEETDNIRKEIESVRDRNFFAYAWDWMKKDIKYVILFASLFNIDRLIEIAKYLIELSK